MTDAPSHLRQRIETPGHPAGRLDAAPSRGPDAPAPADRRADCLRHDPGTAARGADTRPDHDRHAAGTAATLTAAAPIADDLVAALLRRGDSPETRHAYSGDLAVLASWLASEGLAWDAVTADDLDRYREWLAARYARSTVNRRLSVTRSLYSEAEYRGRIARDPAARLRGLRGRDERAGRVLTLDEARAVLEAVLRDADDPARRLRALRDRAMLGILIRTGLRRGELAGLRLGDLGETAGHSVITVRGKGAVLRTAKLPPALRRDVEAWLGAAADAGAGQDASDPLFVSITRGGRLDRRQPISGRAVHAIVGARLARAGLARLGPHAMRATFVTLALEGGAPLHRVQQAAGHADPRTTERYWRRRESLDDAATDYVRL